MHWWFFFSIFQCLFVSVFPHWITRKNCWLLDMLDFRMFARKSAIKPIYDYSVVWWYLLAAALAEQILMHRSSRKVERESERERATKRGGKEKKAFTLWVSGYLPIFSPHAHFTTRYEYYISYILWCLLLLVNGNSIKWKSSNDFHKVHRLLRKSSKWNCIYYM